MLCCAVLCRALLICCAVLCCCACREAEFSKSRLICVPPRFSCAVHTVLCRAVTVLIFVPCVIGTAACRQAEFLQAEAAR